MSENNGQSKPRVWSFTRASTAKQVESPATQRGIIEAACKSLGLGEATILDEPIGTSGRSKKFAQRPIGHYLLRTLRKGDTLVVSKLDRLGRNLRDIYDTVDTFFQRGVSVIILHGWGNRVVDLRSATDRIFLLLLAWFAEYEGERISERTKEGLAFRRNNGLATGHRFGCYIQAFDAEGREIPSNEYQKLRGDHKRNLPDTQFLDQLCELLVLQKATRANGLVLYDYCQERKFVNHSGKEWWRGTVHYSANGFPYMNAISQALKKVRRLAVLGKLPEDYNCRVLSITGDSPASVQPKWKRKVQPDATPTAAPSEADMESWNADQLRAWIRQSQSISSTEPNPEIR